LHGVSLELPAAPRVAKAAGHAGCVPVELNRAHTRLKCRLVDELDVGVDDCAVHGRDEGVERTEATVDGGDLFGPETRSWLDERGQDFDDVGFREGDRGIAVFEGVGRLDVV